MSDFDLGALFKQAADMQNQLAATAAQQFEGQAGGGLVKVTIKGSGEVVSVRIDPSVVDPSDVETLEDLIVAACAAAARQATDAHAQAMGGIGDLGGLGGQLGGLLGGV